MRYFLGWPFVTDGAEVVSPGATNPSYLTNWFTEQRIVTASGTSATITINLGPTGVPVHYVDIYNLEVLSPALSPTWRAQVYDDEDATGTELLDTGILPAVPSFSVSSTLSTPAADPPQLIYLWTEKESGGRSVPAGTTTARSILLSFSTSSPATHSIGYVAAGDLISLSDIADVSASFAPTSSSTIQPAVATGGGITTAQAVNTSTYPFSLDQMSAEDKTTIHELHAELANSAPFFAYPSDPPASRDQQLGIVRFSDQSLRFQKLDTMRSAAGRYSMEASVTPWR